MCVTGLCFKTTTPGANTQKGAPRILSLSWSRFTRRYSGNPFWFLFLHWIICLNSMGDFLPDVRVWFHVLPFLLYRRRPTTVSQSVQRWWSTPISIKGELWKVISWVCCWYDNDELGFGWYIVVVVVVVESVDFWNWAQKNLLHCCNPQYCRSCYCYLPTNHYHHHHHHHHHRWRWWCGGNDGWMV